MTVLFYYAYLVLKMVYVDKSYVKQALNGTDIPEKDRAKVTKIVYGVLDKDITLSYYLSKLCDKSPKTPIKIILKIALYNIEYLGKSDYAVTDSAVTLLKKMGKSGASGFVNATLRAFCRQKPQIPSDNGISGLSVKYSYPEFLLAKLTEKYTLSEIESILSYSKNYTSIRFSSCENGQEYLDNLKITYQKTPFENLFLCENFKMEQGFSGGKYTFQSIGSVAICEIVGSGENLLDCCSAPGGKSVYLAQKFKTVTSCELHDHRCELIRSYAKRMGVSNISVEQADSTVFNEKYLDKFDCVLADVPCSGTGVILDNPDIKLQRAQEDIPAICDVQQKILQNVCKYVKIGGTLTYSTCSILAQENEEQIQKFLSEHTEFVCEKIDSKLGHRAGKYGLTFLPDISMGAGFYCCKLRRVK